MSDLASKCSKCFAHGSNIEQANFTNRGDAFGLYRVLVRHGQLPMLCQTGASAFKVCYPAGSVSETASAGTAERESHLS